MKYSSSFTDLRKVVEHFHVIVFILLVDLCTISILVITHTAKKIEAMEPWYYLLYLMYFFFLENDHFLPAPELMLCRNLCILIIGYLPLGKSLVGLLSYLVGCLCLLSQQDYLCSNESSFYC